MLFSLVSQDIENSTERRMSVRPAHLERLQALADAGRLVVAGPSPVNPNGDPDQGFSGSIIIADFSDLDEAQRWAEADPYVSAGVYASVSVKPFNASFDLSAVKVRTQGAASKFGKFASRTAFHSVSCEAFRSNKAE